MIKITDTKDAEHILMSAYLAEQRLEITWKPGFEDYSGYGSRSEGRKARGYIGRSTGSVKLFLLILRRDSLGGSAISPNMIESITPLDKYRRD